MKRSKCCCGGVVALVVAVAILNYFHPIITSVGFVRISPKMLQSEIADKFPLEKHALLLTARFTDPKIALENGSNRLGLGVTTTIEAPGHKLLSGRTEVDGEISYNRATGDLFLNNPKVTALRIDGLPKEYEGVARSLAGSVLEGYLSKMPIYSLDRSAPDDYRRAVAKRLVKSIKVENGLLVVEFGL
jgi:hypothetical protein